MTREKPANRTATGTAEPRFVVRLRTTAADLAAAQQIARVMARSLSFLRQLEPGATTVSAEDAPDAQHPVFCDRRLSGGRRCMLRTEHGGTCLPRARRR